MLVANDVSELIGHTPMLKLDRLFPGPDMNVLAKLELFNPMSIKDRPVLNMIRKAMGEGLIGPGTEVVEASSGNTAIAIASLATVMGFKARIYMSELCSMERQQILRAYGAELVMTPGEEHTKGARERAMAYCDDNPDRSFFLNQHGNPNNGGAHEATTGPEIWEQTGGDIGAVVLGLGTSGSFDGISRYLKGKNPDIRVVGFEPASSPVYSGGEQAPHRIIGIGPGFVTENFKRSEHNLDELMVVEDDVAFDWARKVGRKEGLLVGVTSGAGAWAAGQVAQREEMKGKNVICIFYDTGERYLSVEGLFT